MTSLYDPSHATESVSIFCRENAFSRVAQTLEVDAQIVEIDDDPANPTIVALCGAQELRVAALPWTGPGQPLAKTILGALAYVRRIPTSHEAQRQDLLNALAECRLLLGLTGSPGCLAYPSCLSAIHAIAAEMNGILFDGADFHSPEGILLFSHDGRSERR